MINFEDNNYCEHCGEKLIDRDEITIREGKVFHTICLPENLKNHEEKAEEFGL